MPKPALKPPVDITTLRAIVRVVQSGGAVDFDPVRGVICNLCGHHAQGKGLGVTRTMYQAGSLRERYHTCPNCGRRFKSIEPRPEQPCRT